MVFHREFRPKGVGMSELVSVQIAERQRVAAVMPPAREVMVPGVDDDEGDGEGRGSAGAAAEIDIGYAEGQTFMIEYQNADGLVSVRRITVFSISERKDGRLLLRARCHERKATRSFRVDRIRCCIDYDGEVFEDVPSFLDQTFGMAQKASTREFGVSAAARAAALREMVGDQAVLFRAMAFADFFIGESEVNACVQVLANTIERAGVVCSQGDCQWLERYFRRLRPSEVTIRAAVNSMSAKSAREKDRFLRDLVAVMDADGVRHPLEMELLDLLAIELTGVGIG